MKKQTNKKKNKFRVKGSCSTLAVNESDAHHDFDSLSSTELLNDSSFVVPVKMVKPFVSAIEMGHKESF